jgi:hypothetical protein
MINISPSPSLITASPIIACLFHSSLATSLSVSSLPPRFATGTFASVSGVVVASTLWMANRFSGVSTKPPVPMCAPSL